MTLSQHEKLPHGINDCFQQSETIVKTHKDLKDKNKRYDYGAKQNKNKIPSIPKIPCQ